MTTKPPAMLIDDNNTANDANAWGPECGKYPPPKISKPPTAVTPEIAFVIDIKGVCKAGDTPHTEKYPVITDKENILAMVKIAGSAQTYPNPRKPRSPPDNVNAFFRVFLNKFTYLGLAALTYVFGADFEASNMGGFGFGHNNYLSLVIIAPLTT